MLSIVIRGIVLFGPCMSAAGYISDRKIPRYSGTVREELICSNVTETSVKFVNDERCDEKRDAHSEILLLLTYEIYDTYHTYSPNLS